MSRYRRSNAPDATFFFTVNSLNRRPLLTTDRVRDALRNAIADVRARAPFLIHAWVLLPDHLHCIWELPADDAAFGLRWSLIKRQVTQACGSSIAETAGLSPNSSRLRRHEGILWQRRFWEHQIRDDRDFERRADYIHYNPVKHGLVQRVCDWPYSTFHRYVANGTHAADWAGETSAPGRDVDYGE